MILFLLIPIFVGMLLLVVVDILQDMFGGY
jgi:hypothetical protein